MTNSDAREIVVPVIALVIHPVVTFVLCVVYGYCIKPFFKKRLSTTTPPNVAVSFHNLQPLRPHEVSIPLRERYGRDNNLLNDDKLPSYWENRGKCVIKVDITDTATAEFIKNLVQELWSSSDVGIGRDATAGGPAFIKIKKVYRVENTELFLKYDENRQKMIKKKMIINVDHFRSLQELTNPEIRTTEIIRKKYNIRNSPLNDVIYGINEHFLFHGTKPENVDSVWRTGLRTEFLSRGAFGNGIYMAENPTKSDQYTGNTNGDKHMFLCRACLGEMYVLTTNLSDYDTPPCRKRDCEQTNCTRHKYTFDSIVVDIPGLRFREFIVFRDYRTYPEYLIIYKHINSDSQA